MVVLLFLFPVLVTAGLLLFMKGHFDTKQLMINTGVALGVCYLLAGLFYALGTSHATYSEVWTFKGVEMEHQERWSEHVTYTVQVACGTYTTGTGKNRVTHTRYRTETRHRTDYHGPYWYVWGDDGAKRDVSQNEYNKYKGLWANERKTGEHRGTAAWLDKPITGGIYRIAWTGKFETIHPIKERHRYVNKVRASDHSVFKLKEPTEDLITKYPRPVDEGNLGAVVTYGVSPSNVDGEMLDRLNSKVGPGYQLHVLFVFVPASQGPGVVEDILTAWQLPNKNELAVFIGYDPVTRTAAWCQSTSWMDNTTMHGMVADCIVQKEITTELLLDSINKNLRYWHRKSFKDFEYLEIECRPWAVITGCIVMLIGAIGTIIVILNPQWFEQRSYRW